MMITGHDIMFYLLALLTLGCGVVAVTSQLIFRAAIALLFSLIGIAGLYFWMDMQFIAAVQIVVYVGGIVVLIIFSIFLTQKAGEKLPQVTLGRNLFSLLAVFCAIALVLVQVLPYSFPTQAPMENANVVEIGKRMLSLNQGGYALPFEVVSILLLAAMVGCIVIAIKYPDGHAPKEIEIVNEIHIDQVEN